jgi:hypothetical protein
VLRRRAGQSAPAEKRLLVYQNPLLGCRNPLIVPQLSFVTMIHGSVPLLPWAITSGVSWATAELVSRRTSCAPG